MLKLNKKVEYALISVIHLDSMGRSDLVTARELAERYNIPGEILGKVLQSLAKARIVESVQGAKGGYRLLLPLEKVTMGDMIEAIESPVYLVSCQDDPESCGQFDACNIRNPVWRIQARLTRFIHGIPLSALRHNTSTGGLASEESETAEKAGV
jgi:Rrf2 family protein